MPTLHQHLVTGREDPAASPELAMNSEEQSLTVQPRSGITKTAVSEPTKVAVSCGEGCVQDDDDDDDDL